MISGVVGMALITGIGIGADGAGLASAAPVTVLSPTVNANVVNITTSLNVRNGPALSNRVVGSLKNGTKITITGYTANGWLRMKTSSISLGYVSAAYVRVPVVSVSLAAKTGNLSTGKTVKAVATIFPPCATNKTVTWDSSDPTVATVNAGVITGWSAGQTTITARTADGARKATAVYSVSGQPVQYISVAGVSIAPTQPVMSGRTRQLSVAFAPADASNKAVTWSSSSTNVASVSSAGLLSAKVTGLGKSTSVTITVKSKDSGVTAKASVKIYSVHDVQARLNTLGCRNAKGQKLVVDGVIGVNSTAAIKNFQGYAGLTKDGVAGAATLAAMFGGVACTGNQPAVNPTPTPTPPQPDEPSPTPSEPPSAPGAVTGVEVTKGQPILTGNTQQLTATVAPPEAKNKTVVWSTSSTGTATVSTSGVVTGVVKGTGKSAAATITVKTADGGKTAATSVMVYTGQDVQVKLNSLGCKGADNKVLTVDGAIGSNSKSATRDFQVANGVTANGLVSSATLAALFGASPKQCKAGSTVPLDLTGFKYKWKGKYVTQEFLNKVLDISKKLKANPDDLMADMAFESGLNPYAQNASSGATGLIQFMPSTAAGMGTSTAKMLEMTPERQLDYVYEYLKRFTGQLNTTADVVVAVLWPIAVGKPDSYILFSKGGGAYAGNSGLDLNKDGHVTKGEAAQRAINIRNSYGLR